MRLIALLPALCSVFVAVKADNCYVHITQQFNGGIGGSASPINGQVLRGVCPMNVNEDNTDNCREIATFTPSGGDPSVVTSELPYTVIIQGLGGTNGFNDGYGDYSDQHFDFHSDSCQFSQSSGFSANLNMQSCIFTCP